MKPCEAPRQVCYRLFHRDYIKYLESIYALYLSTHQKQRAISDGTLIRRPQTDCIHPVIRVHSVTGIKAIYHPSYTKFIVNVPKSESKSILGIIFRAMESTLDMQVRVKWEMDKVLGRDNRMTWHSGIGDCLPGQRPGLRAFAIAEIPMSIQEYEEKKGKKALDWFDVRMMSFGIDD